MQKIAIVTGSSSGIGEAIAKRLLQLEYVVYGVSRSCSITHEHYTHLEYDLIEKIPTEVKKIDVSLLVNCAGFGVFEPHEQISEKTISDMCDLNIKAPITLTNMTLRALKKNEGTIINITSIEATRSAKFSALYSATKSALKAFSASLFEEVRKDGVNVVSINPDMTETPFFDKLKFKASSKDEKALLAEDIADAVENILGMRDGANITDLTIRSKKFGIIKK
ncbi:MAG: SDR family NAD(P)-dependent oxidoreductase [Helicobacteraceae bacterium]|nr:SDR family NAD(P)-dependent oxidoreductase [Helicobacteraceae bacterium]